MAKQPPPKLVNEGRDRKVSGVDQQDLLGGDDSLDVLQVYHNGPLSPQHRGRAQENRVEDPEVPGGQTRSPHDGVLSCLHNLRVATGVNQQPGTDTRRRLGAFLPGRRRQRKAH